MRNAGGMAFAARSTITSLWLMVVTTSAASAAAPTPSLKTLQARIKRLEHQVQAIKRARRHDDGASVRGIHTAIAGKHDPAALAPAVNAGKTPIAAEKPEQAEKRSPEHRLVLGGSATAAYQIKQRAKDNNAGGSARFDRFVLNIHGQYERWSFGIEQRFHNFDNANLDNGAIFHYGWAGRTFGAGGHHRIKAGFYQVPFGNLRYGFFGYWGSLAYFAGYTNNQALGIGYRYQNGPWRIDINAFKNDDAGQKATYGTNPSAGYDRINGLNLRAAYTVGKPGADHATFSLATRAGRLSVGENDAHGHRLAATLAMNAALGPWRFQAQAVDFRFDVPSGQHFNGEPLPADSVAIEHYGFPARLPDRGQIYGLNIARRLPEIGGDTLDFKLYNNFGYLHSGAGAFDSAGNRIGDVVFNGIGLAIHHGPFHVWLETLAGRNAGLAGLGPNDGDWHWRYNATFGVYFSGVLGTGS